MEAYDFNSLATDLQNWMTSRFLNPILDIEGGWEYWIQIDFPAWLDIYHKCQYDFRREVPGVLSNARLDWLVNSQVGGQLTAVEIKAQTHKYLDDRFISEVLADVGKLAVLDHGFHKIMLAAVISPSASARLTAEHLQGRFVPIARFSDTIQFLAYIF